MVLQHLSKFFSFFIWDPIKRNLKYLPGNIQYLIKNINIKNQHSISYKMVYKTLNFSFISDQILKLILRLGKIDVKIYKIKFQGSKES